MSFKTQKLAYYVLTNRINFTICLNFTLYIINFYNLISLKLGNLTLSENIESHSQWQALKGEPDIIFIEVLAEDVTPYHLLLLIDRTKAAYN